MRNPVSRSLLGIGLAFGVLFAAIPGGRAAEKFLFGSSGGDIQFLQLTFSDTSHANVLASDQGWWSYNDTNGPNNTNYIVGRFASGPGFEADANNFFSFLLNIAPGNPVVGAILVLNRNDSAGMPATYSLYDVTTDSTVLANPGPSNQAIFDDLGSGLLYGSVLVTSNLVPDPLEIVLNQNAIDAINAVGREGNFSIGGSLNLAQVPEPASLGVLGAALLGLVVACRRTGRA